MGAHRFLVSGLLLTTLAANVPAAAAAESWYPSRYGADDTIGAANQLSPAKVLEAARLVKTGKTYSLGVITGPEAPAYPPRQFALTVLQPGDGTGTTMGSNKATGNDDMLQTWMGIGSQSISRAAVSATAICSAARPMRRKLIPRFQCGSTCRRRPAKLRA